MKSYLAGLSLTKKIVYGAIVLLLGWGAYRLWFAPKQSNYQLATVTRGTIVQQVSVTGNTAPVTSLDLAFETGGTISAVNFDVGAHVRAGDALARLNTSD